MGKMMISTKGRYAIRMMIDLAQHSEDGFVPLKDIAERQEISLKYLESIVGILSKANYVTGLHGKGGGYKLNKKPEEYKISDILKLTEGSLAPVSCLEGSPNTCPRAGKCNTLPMWEKLYRLIDDFFSGITIKDLM